MEQIIEISDDDSNRLTTTRNRIIDMDLLENDLYDQQSFRMPELEGLNILKELKQKSLSSKIKIMTNQLMIDERIYKLPQAGLVVIGIIADLYHLALVFKNVSKFCIQKTMSIALFFNSTICQLVLGAGASKLGIEKISDQHLALSIQPLKLIIQLLPKIKDNLIIQFQKNSNDESETENKIQWLQNEMNKLQKDFNNHISEVLAKISNIVSPMLFNFYYFQENLNRITQKCKEIPAIEWENQFSKINIPTKTTASILMHLRQLYIKIEDLVQYSDIEIIFSQLFKHIQEEYIKMYENLNIVSRVAAQRIKEDLEYFESQLSELQVVKSLTKEFGAIQKSIKNIIEGKCNQFLESISLNLS